MAAGVSAQSERTARAPKSLLLLPERRLHRQNLTQNDRVALHKARQAAWPLPAERWQMCLMRLFLQRAAAQQWCAVGHRKNWGLGRQSHRL